MSTFEIAVTVPGAVAQRLSDGLAGADRPMAVASGLFETKDKAWRVFAHYDTPPDPGELAALFARYGAGTPPAAQRIEPRDWIAHTQRLLAPVRAGPFLIHGSHDRARAKGRRYAIEIEAGQAFGTAHHATTRGCLLLLHRALSTARPRRVLDLGTGSGILAIAAAKLGDGEITASDSDPVAVRVARDNARLNGVGSRVRTLNARGLSHPRLRARRFDLVLANILAGPLHRLAPALKRSVARKGQIILSGLTADQAASIEARYRAHGFILQRRLRLDGWAVLLMQRTR